MKTLRVLAAVTAMVSLVLPSAVRAEDSQLKAGSENIKLVRNFPYEGGTDIDFLGNFAYAGAQGNKGGIRVFNIAGKSPKEVAFVPCPGGQNDVAMVRKGLLALGYHEGNCGKKAGGGVRLIDVKNPKRPKYLDSVDLPGGTHTLTKYPGKPIMYASPGGLVNGGGVEQILDVSNPRNIKVAATFKPHDVGCHDITFMFSKKGKIAFCPNLSGTEIWDVADPLKPVLISRITSPIQDFHHLAVPSPDGKYPVISDENFEAHECLSGQGLTGAMYVWDITELKAPILAGKFSPQRGAESDWGGSPPPTSREVH